MPEKPFHRAFLDEVRRIYGHEAVPLHRPVFSGQEKQYLADCIDSNFVSSAGERVTEFEKVVAAFCGAAHGVAVVNGTSALQVALRLVGVERDTEVITQALTFVATCNAVAYLDAKPVFIDVERATLGMSPEALKRFLSANVERRDEGCFNRLSRRRVSACMPMHTFGHPCRIDEIAQICADWDIPLVEDAAESLGSWYKGQHTGTFGRLGVFSFNGNKIITTGGGGMIITDDAELAHKAKHLTTTAKVDHPYEYFHDEVGYNFRMPNLNAALGCAQMEQLEGFLKAKREVARQYQTFFENKGVEWITEPVGARSNYWLNAIVLNSASERDEFLEFTNSNGVMTRPIWKLMSELPMYFRSEHGDIEVSRWLEKRIVNLPSSAPNLLSF